MEAKAMRPVRAPSCKHVKHTPATQDIEMKFLSRQELANDLLESAKQIKKESPAAAHRLCLAPNQDDLVCLSKSSNNLAR